MKHPASLQTKLNKQTDVGTKLFKSIIIVKFIQNTILNYTKLY